MTIEEARTKLWIIRARQGPIGANRFDLNVKEDDHVDADAILLDLINDDEINAAYHSIEKWYA